LSTERTQAGLTLIELMIFVVVLGVGLAGVLLAINQSTVRSADPMIRKQALAAAESLLEEVLQQPFTYCDPRDANAPTATGSGVGATACSAGNYSMDNTANWGALAGKSRYGPEFFNNVADYNTFSMVGNVQDVLGQASSRLTGYSASVAVSQVGNAFNGAYPNADVLKVTVSVTGASETLVLTGFRFRHSPNLTN
jgi:MSHA pilin protein MshD